MLAILRIAPVASLLIAASALAQAPTMDSLWPNTDGLTWLYAQHYEDFGVIPEVIDNQVLIFFDGTTVAPNGIQAQYLREVPVQTVSAPKLFNAALPDPFLRYLWIARPDLKARIAQRVADASCPQFAPPQSYALLLTGEHAYRKTADEIAAWRCTLPDTRSWLWLVSDLTIGNSFTLQLVPDLASDVFLHGTIGAIESVTVPAGTYDGCVRVDYVIDYGSSECRDDAGNVTGAFRSETRGYVDYAPGVGPVKSYEEFIPIVEAQGPCALGAPIGQAAAAASLEMKSVTTPVRHRSWGQLKITYR